MTITADPLITPTKVAFFLSKGLAGTAPGGGGGPGGGEPVPEWRAFGGPDIGRVAPAIEYEDSE